MRTYTHTCICIHMHTSRYFTSRSIRVDSPEYTSVQTSCCSSVFELFSFIIIFCIIIHLFHHLLLHLLYHPLHFVLSLTFHLCVAYLHLILHLLLHLIPLILLLLHPLLLLLSLSPPFSLTAHINNLCVSLSADQSNNGTTFTLSFAYHLDLGTSLCVCVCVRERECECVFANVCELQSLTVCTLTGSMFVYMCNYKCVFVRLFMYESIHLYSYLY